MAIQFQLRKGTTVQNDAFTGAEGELTYNTTTKGLRIHDGSHQGGYEVPVLVSVQRPTSDNNYTWARVWSDGWVEQGGFINDTSTGTFTITLPVTMSDNNYNIQLTGSNNNSSGKNNTALWGVRVDTKTTSAFTTAGNLVNNSSQTTFLSDGILLSWEVKGMAA